MNEKELQNALYLHRAVVAGLAGATGPSSCEAVDTPEAGTVFLALSAGDCGIEGGPTGS